MWPTRIKHNQGFTLMEMLLAISIFAVLGLASSSVMQQVVRVDKVSQEAQERIKGLQQTMSMMERDFGQMVARNTHEAVAENKSQYFEYGANVSGYEGQALRFFRLGWLNPQGLLPRGSVQQVVYRIEEEKLQRLYTLYPDPVSGDEAQVLDLLTGVKQMSFSFFIDNRWQTEVDGTVFPKAVAVSLETEDFGLIERRFLLADGFVVEQPVAEGGEQEGEGEPSDNEQEGSGSEGPDDLGGADGYIPEDGGAEGYAPEGSGGAEGFAE